MTSLIQTTINLFFISLLFFVAFKAKAEDLPSIYDSPTDKTKVVLEYCGKKQCYRLLMDKKSLKTKQKEISEWFDKILDLEGE